MRYTELICRVAKDSIKRGAELGVRLSPMLLEPQEARLLLEDVRGILGDKIHVAAFIPGADELDEPRVYIGDEERAAERATRWRNTIHPEQGEHVLYIAARRHGKAGGLEDTLMPIDEQRLRVGFIDWCGTCELLPPGLGSALQEADIISRTEARALCEYVAAYLARVDATPDWVAAGELLPLLSLPKDTNLSEEDAASRLKANVTWATRAAMGEGRGAKPKSDDAKELLSQLEQAFGRLGDARLAHLAQVNLGELDTYELVERKRSRKKPVKALNEKSLPKVVPKKKTRARKTTKAKKREAQAARLEETLKVSSPPPRETSTSPRGSGDAKELLRGATLGKEAPTRSTSRAPATALASAAPEPEPRQPTNAAAAGPTLSAHAAREEEVLALEETSEATAWTESMQEREFGGIGQLPHGLYELIYASLATPDGDGLLWRVSSGPLKPLLEQLPKGLEPPEVRELEFEESAGVALEVWRERRRALAQALLAGPSQQAHFVRMVNAPLLVLQDPGLREMAIALMQASADLYNVVADDTRLDVAARARVLELDTMCVEADDGQRLLALSPLHPLPLGQALARYEALLNAHDTSSNIRSVMTRSLLQAPVCPSTWPLSSGGQVSLSQYDQNIIVYESNPADATDEDIEVACELLLLQYFDLHPHARAGMNVLIRGGSPAPVLEGFARALSRASDAHVNAFIHINNDGITRKLASALMEEGRMTLRATPAVEDRLKPHLVIQLNPAAGEGRDRLVSSPPKAQYTGGVSALQPTFELVGEGLVTRTSVKGVQGVEEAEALLASIKGHAARGYIELSEAAARLSAVFPKSTSQDLTWQAAISAHISRRPRPDASLLIYEDVGDAAHVAVVTSSKRPIIQVLRKAFKRMGSEHLRDSQLEAIATHLSRANNKGLLSLTYTEEQSLAAALLGLWLKVNMVNARGVVAHIEGVHTTTLLGAHDETSAGTFALAAYWRDQRLYLQVGYAALAAPMELKRNSGRLSGRLYTKLSRFLEVLRYALSGGDTLSARAAREALNWLLWPALAAEANPNPGLVHALEQLEGGIEHEITVRILLPADHPAIDPGATNRINDAPIEIVGGDIAWMDHLLMNSQGVLL